MKLGCEGLQGSDFLPAFHVTHSESNYSFDKTRPWSSDKNLVSVVTKVNAAMAQKTVLELYSQIT